MNLHTVENNDESQKILNDNATHFSKQCQLVYDLLKSGEKLTSKDALIKYGIGHLPRRILDLKENGVVIQSNTIDGRYKEYYLQ